jgi:N-acyl-L-homoserine lactone synthetase
MITVIDSTNHHLHADTLRDFAALRYEIFINRLAWPLDCEPGFETDQFDGPDAVYLIIQNPRGEVVAGSRMLNTAKPSLLRDVFSHLVDGETPVHPDIWDVTRFAVDHRRDRLEGCGNVCAELLTGMIEWGVSVDSQRFVSVSDVRVEPILRRAGWRFLRIGKVLEMDGTGVTALSHQVNEEVLAECRRRASISTKLLTRELIREAA